MILVRDLNLHISETEDEQAALLRELTGRLGLDTSAIRSFRILKESVDARSREDIYFSYQLLVSLAEEEEFLRNSPGEGISLHYSEEEPKVLPGREKPDGRIIVAGFGPAGMFCALTLAKAGYRPLVVERGFPVEERTQAVESFWKGGAFTPQSNVQFGEGGAGTFSDGKLTTRIRDPRVGQVISTFIEAGAPEEIAWLNKPHVGTDLLKNVVTNIRREILRLGGEIRFRTQLDGLVIQDGALRKAALNGEEIACGALILCPGHSARDTYELLERSGVALEAKAFAVGLRVEHLQQELDENQYGRWASHPKLRASEYTLAARTGNGRGVYSFCMCPGGQVVNASSEEGHLCVNGMSFHARDLKNANSAIVVSVSPKDYGEDPLAGIAFQRKLEQSAFRMGGSQWSAPVQLTADYIKGRPSRGLKKVMPSVGPGFVFAPLHELLPPEVTESLREGMSIFGRRIRGFDRDGVFTGVETRTSAPLRILRSGDRQSPSLSGLYPCGEGAGYAGGIVSAAVDGIRTAEAIITRFSNDPEVN